MFIQSCLSSFKAEQATVAARSLTCHSCRMFAWRGMSCCETVQQVLCVCSQVKYVRGGTMTHMRTVCRQIQESLTHNTPVYLHNTPSDVVCVSVCVGGLQRLLAEEAQTPPASLLASSSSFSAAPSTQTLQLIIDEPMLVFTLPPLLLVLLQMNVMAVWWSSIRRRRPCEEQG